MPMLFIFQFFSTKLHNIFLTNMQDFNVTLDNESLTLFSHTFIQTQYLTFYKNQSLALPKIPEIKSSSLKYIKKHSSCTHSSCILFFLKYINILTHIYLFFCNTSHINTYEYVCFFLSDFFIFQLNLFITRLYSIFIIF